MIEKVVPMIHVPNVRATVDWYQDIGFTLSNSYGDGDKGLSFAILKFGNSELMFNQGGQPSNSHRREVDLYVSTDKVDDLYSRLKDRVDVVEGPHDTFYGMRELIIRDLNRFWITFAEESAFARLLKGVHEGNAEGVRNALGRGGLKPETLNAAMAAASSGENPQPEIVEILKKAGAVRTPEIDDEILQSYAGKYRGDMGEFVVTYSEGKLRAALGDDRPLNLIAVDQVTFRPADFDNYGTVSFRVEAGRTIGCALKHGSQTIELKRLDPAV